MDPSRFDIRAAINIGSIVLETAISRNKTKQRASKTNSMWSATVTQNTFLPSVKPHGQHLIRGVRRSEEHFKKINFFNFVSSTFDS